ncbi:hypothetical protein BU26DRAFT_562314 [Trematosphaeria pertusa]|uniref:Uncharacterized protein n=1 Tax=Trematosphaeria pertusa TaxID=390896 RepID=A0A6A6ISK6_9PLEO|nr:uncharacterized protein BU26DRAFT_562314 [Trematosphaeria pertusa]KAF2252580.1 hypothetical protein BU26DRAFT_562314 [Trematosphaeria pertusa]
MATLLSPSAQDSRILSPRAFEPGSSGPTFTLQLPFVLLGRKGLNAALDKHSQRHAKRLEVVYNALQQFCAEVPVQVWVARRFDEDDGKTRTVRTEEERRALRREVEQRRKVWLREEQERWRGYEQSGAWVLRATDTGSEPSVGILGGWKESDGLLTEQEQDLKGNRIWAAAFTLQRCAVGRNDMERLGREVESLLGVFGQTINGFEHPEHGAMFKVVVGERCEVKIAFLPGGGAQGEERDWEEAVVGNLLLLLTAFERELLVLSSPTNLLAYWPLSRWLTHRAVCQLERERKGLWRSLRGGEVGGDKRRRREWGRVVETWVRNLEREDEGAGELKRLLEEERKWWWEEVDDVIKKEEGLGVLVRDMVGFERRGRRVAVRFCVVEGQEEDESSGAKKEKGGTDGYEIEEAQNEDGAEDVVDEISLPPTPPPELPQAFPQIRSIVFNTPLRTLSAPPIKAYIELLCRLVGFSCEKPYGEVRKKVKGLREAAGEMEEAPLETLSKLADMIGVSAKTIRHLERHWDPPGQVHGKEKEKPEAKEDLFAPLLKHIVRSYEEEKAYMPTFTERYESVGGFQVPARTKVYALMMAEEEARKDERQDQREEADEDEFAKHFKGGRQ